MIILQKQKNMKNKNLLITQHKKLSLFTKDKNILPNNNINLQITIDKCNQKRGVHLMSLPKQRSMSTNSAVRLGASLSNIVLEGQSSVKRQNNHSEQRNFNIRKKTIKIKTREQQRKSQRQISIFEIGSSEINDMESVLQYMFITLEKVSFLKISQNSYYCRKINFLKLLSYIILYTCHHKTIKIKKQYRSFEIINETLTQVKRLAMNSHLEQHKLMLKITPKVIDYRLKSLQFSKEACELREEVENLRRQKVDLIEATKKLNQELNNAKDQYSFIKKQIRLFHQQQSYYKKEIAQRQIELNKLKAVNDKLHVQSNFIQQQSKKVKQYVQNQQNKKILHQISKQYMEIQSQLYEYASYLKSNQLATAYDYDPTYFHITQEELNQELRQINSCIMDSKNKELNDKNRLMRDFVLKATNKYKKYGQQVKKLLEFKTKCIKQYVTQMENWLYNWDLKNQFVSNLRKEFTVDYQQLIIQANNCGKNCCSNCCQDIQTSKKIIIDYIQKIAENFKMGNSFY